MDLLHDVDLSLSVDDLALRSVCSCSIYRERGSQSRPYPRERSDWVETIEYREENMAMFSVSDDQSGWNRAILLFQYSESRAKWPPNS